MCDSTKLALQLVATAPFTHKRCQASWPCCFEGECLSSMCDRSLNVCIFYFDHVCRTCNIRAISHTIACTRVSHSASVATAVRDDEDLQWSLASSLRLNSRRLERDEMFDKQIPLSHGKHFLKTHNIAWGASDSAAIQID